MLINKKSAKELKESNIDLIRKQAKQEKSKEIKKDFQPIFEVLNIDKSPEIIKIWRKHLGGVLDEM